jgi:hypothetical protein
MNSDKPNMGDRQWGAALIVLAMALGVPILVGFALLLATAWIAAVKTLGIDPVRDIHGTLWGWLSVRKHHKGQVSWGPNTLPIAWIMLWVNLWLLYELAEGIGLMVRGFANLARPNKVEIVENTNTATKDLQRRREYL